MITQRPVVTYVNKIYLNYFIINSRRTSHNDPRYYVNVYVEALIPLDNTVRVSSPTPKKNL